MAATAQYADSLVAGLCREIDAIRGRGFQVQASLARCGNADLRRRLLQEWEQLQERRLLLLRAARDWQRAGSRDPLALGFLIEVCSRPLVGAALP